MKIGAFEVQEPLPELREPHVLAILRPWIDVNNVGTMTLDGLEAQFQAKEMAQLSGPGDFFDFTRYRPMLYLEDGVRRVKIPNTTLSYAKREKGNDFLFLRLLEPHSRGEDFVGSVLELLKVLRVKRYCLLGSMYDAVPHTKPLLINGRASGKDAEQDLKRAGVQPSNYKGPTTITYLIAHKSPDLGIETATFIVVDEAPAPDAAPPEGQDVVERLDPLESVAAERGSPEELPESPIRLRKSPARQRLPLSMTQTE